MTNSSLHSLRRRAIHGAIFPCKCDYTGPQWQGATRCAHCGGLLRTATDTGIDHGPAEGFVSDNGLALESSSNGAPQPGSWRAERRARDLRDIGALRYFARLHDRTGACGAAQHCRELASIYAMSATLRAMPYSASIAPTTDLPVHGPAQPTI